MLPQRTASRSLFPSHPGGRLPSDFSVAALNQLAEILNSQVMVFQQSASAAGKTLRSVPRTLSADVPERGH